MSKWVPVLAIDDDDYITKPSDLTQLGKIVKTKWEKYTKPAKVR